MDDEVCLPDNLLIQERCQECQACRSTSDLRVVPHPASLPLAVFHFRLPSPQLLTIVTTSGCSLLVSVNTPPYPAPPVIFTMFPSLPHLDQTPRERGDALVHHGTWPVEGLPVLATPSPSFLSFRLSLWLCASSLTSQSLPFYLRPIRNLDSPSLQWAP